MSEKDLMASVIDYARLTGWRVAHFVPAQVRPGVWVTPFKADAKGWPDLSMVRPPRLLFVETKGGGSVEEEQKIWLGLLSQVPNVEVYVWRMRDWNSGVVHRILK